MMPVKRRRAKDDWVRLWLIGQAVVLFALAMGAGQAQEGGPPGGPPPEALSACAVKTPGAPCYFRHREQTIIGRCETKGGDLVCVPDRAPPGPPPEELGDANASRRATAPAGPSSGDASGAFGHPTTGDRSANDAPPSLATGPKPPPEAYQACAWGVDGGECVVQTTKGSINGRCGLYQGRLACIPPRPPRD